MIELADRLLDRIELADNGCWVWQGHLVQGYGVIKVKNKAQYVHRLTFELWREPIPAGLVMDHECHNIDLSCAGGLTCLHRTCVNPWHCAPKEFADNIRQGRSANRLKTYCPKGHPYDEANTSISPEGRRSCRTCGRDRTAAYRIRKAQR